MTPTKHKKDLNALIALIDATTDGLIAYEDAVDVCTLSATAKARLASARLALSTLIESVAAERAELSPAAKKLFNKKGDAKKSTKPMEKKPGAFDYNALKSAANDHEREGRWLEAAAAWTTIAGESSNPMVVKMARQKAEAAKLNAHEHDDTQATRHTIAGRDGEPVEVVVPLRGADLVIELTQEAQAQQSIDPVAERRKHGIESVNDEESRLNAYMRNHLSFENGMRHQIPRVVVLDHADRVCVPSRNAAYQESRSAKMRPSAERIS